MVRPSPHPVFAAERAARRAAARVQERNLAYYAGRPEEIERRLAELDAEMDVERAMDVYGLRAAALGGALAILRGRGWALLPLAVAGMLALQSCTGDSGARRWLRKMGYRTAQEIAAEEDALLDLLDAKTGESDKAGDVIADDGAPRPPLAAAPASALI